MNFDGRNAIVTGGLSGIGYQLAKELLHFGVKVIGIFDSVENKTALEEMRTEFKPKIIEFYKTDVRCSEDIKKSFETFTNKHRYIDFLINSAGIFNENKKEDTVLINLLGLINCTFEAMNLMSTSHDGRGGTIINIASIAGICYPSSVPVYAASKHGVLAFTKSMANETNTKLHGVKFIALCPGFTRTKLISDLSAVFTSDFATNSTTILAKSATQTTKQLGECFRQILPIATNGSAWIIVKGHFKEFIPDYFNADDFVTKNY